MLLNSSQTAKNRAKNLRRKMTLPEILLWKELNKNKIGFRVLRQHPVGSYTLDFFLPEALLCVEVDGQMHEVREEQDVQRDKCFNELGVRTVRIPASSVLKNAAEVAYSIHVIASQRLDREPRPW